jgi:hypothetical protein
MANFMDPHKVVVGNDPKPLNTFILPSRIFIFFNVKKGSIQGSICFKMVLGLLGLGPLFKMTLTCLGIYSFAYC